MSVAYILNQSYSYVENNKLNPALEVATSLKAPVHIIDEGVSISKNAETGAMVLDAEVVETVVVQTDSVNAILGVFTSALNPLLNTTDISVSGNLDLDGGAGIKNITSLTIEGSPAVAGYVLSTTDTNGTLAWVPDATGSTPTISEVLTSGNDAENNDINGLSNVGCKFVRIGTPTSFGTLYVADSEGKDDIVQISGEFGGYIAVNQLSAVDQPAITINSDMVINENNTFKTKNILDNTGAFGTAGQVLKKRTDNDGIEWADDAGGDVSQWSTFTAVSNVNLGSNLLNASKTVTDDVWTNYISLPKNGSGDSIELNSFTNTGKIPTLKCDSITTANPDQTQINVAKDLNIAGNTFTAGLVNSNSINVLDEFFLGSEPNRFSGSTSSVLRHLTGSNIMTSQSGAELRGCFNVEARRGKFYATDANSVERFSATGDGDVSCVMISTTKLNIPTLTPVVGQVLAASNVDGSLFWKDDAAGDVSQWATFDAVQNLDMNNFDITNAGTITSNVAQVSEIAGLAGSIRATSNVDVVAALKVQTVLGANMLLADPNDNSIISQTAADLEGFDNIQSTTLRTTNNPANPDSYTFKVAPSRIDIGTDAFLNERRLYLGATSDSNNLLQDGELRTQNIALNSKVNGSEAPQLVINNSTPETVFQVKTFDNSVSSATSANLSGFGDVASATAHIDSIYSSDYNGTAGNQIGIYPPEDAKVVNIWGTLSVRDDDLLVNDGNVRTQQLIPQYKPERTLWVSANNTFAAPNGTYENPYTTIQDAINYAESVYDNTYWYINVLAGSYAGFTVSKKIFIKGFAPSNPDACSVGCQINSGSIVISVDSNDGDMFNNQVNISNFLIAGVEIECNSGNTARSVLVLTDCYLYQDSGSSGRMIHYNPDATDGRLWLFNTRIINQSTTGLNPVIEISKGMLKMAQCIVSGSGAQNILKLSGTSRIDSVVQCSFTSTTSSTIAPAIVECDSTASLLTFSQCAFIYTSTANKSSSITSSGILLSSPTTQPTLIVSYNSFFLAGTSMNNNFAIQDTNFGTARQAIILYFSNNAALNNAYQIKGSAGVSKFSLQAVA